MRRFIAFIYILSSLLLFCACGAEAPAGGTAALTIVTTVFPAYDFARQVAGDRAEVTLLVPPGTELHSFEPTARDILRIQDCDLFICNGGESEAWVETLLEGRADSAETLVMLSCVDALEEELREGMQEPGGEEEEEGPEYDEHVWTSPVNAQRICREIAASLTEIDPAHAGEWEANCERCCAEFDELDRAFRELVEQGTRRTLIFADRFPLRYFTEEYGLDYYAAFPGCAEDTEPSAQTVAFLIDRVREEQIPVVFYIEFSNQKMADVICQDTGCEKRLFHSCHNVTPEQFAAGVSCAELMRGNLEGLREALG